MAGQLDLNQRMTESEDLIKIVATIYSDCKA